MALNPNLYMKAKPMNGKSTLITFDGGKWEDDFVHDETRV